MADQIIIRGLEVVATIGVPAAERATAQRLEIDLTLTGDFRGLDDDLARTTDYAAVAAWVRGVCAGARCRLLETLADELAAGLLAAFPAAAGVGLEIRKFILPGTRHVAVRVARNRTS